MDFVIETSDGNAQFATAGFAADYLLDCGFADADREPHWHLRWCLERMEPGEDMDMGEARIARDAFPG